MSGKFRTYGNPNLWYHETGNTRNSAAIQPYGHCHPWYLVCFNYLDLVTIPWKMCLLFGHYIVDSMSDKSLHKYHSLYMSGFDSAGNIYILSLFVKHMGPWILCVFHGNHKVHSGCKAFTHLPFAFCLAESKVLVAVSFCPLVVGLS